MQKEIFYNYLKKILPDTFQTFKQKFDGYFSWLIEENTKINLISRQTPSDDIWTFHMMDSLLSIPFVDFSSKTILDFGTGGGFPGIPLAILYPDSKITLLDSKKKKINSLKSAVELLDLKNCSFLDLRIEEVPKSFSGTFDIIVSRSVKILPEFRTPLLNLLKSDGKLVLYKSKILDDVALFKNVSVNEK